MHKILALIVILLGVTAGVAAGLVAKIISIDANQKSPVELTSSKPDTHIKNQTPESFKKQDYLKLNNQFIIPLVQENSVNGLVALSVSLELDYGYKETVYSLEPKLRDAFLQILFDHANIGGFNGQFTDSLNLDVLRNNLFGAAKKILGDKVTDILITDIARQDH
tara:strand:- start:677 stop:1171 length:495 start_codon:yes stop_codon:yes gene_type:complete